MDSAADAFEKFKTGDINNEFTRFHVWAEKELRHRSPGSEDTAKSDLDH